MDHRLTSEVNTMCSMIDQQSWAAVIKHRRLCCTMYTKNHKNIEVLHQCCVINITNILIINQVEIYKNMQTYYILIIFFY